MKDSARPALPLFGNDRPAAFDDPQTDRRPDCLLALLFDLVHVEIRHLPALALQDWFRQVGVVLDLLPTEEKRRIWSEMVADRIVQQFPKFVGGIAACRLQIGCMRQKGRYWWETWKCEHAPPFAVPAKTAAPATGPSESEP